MRIGQWLPVSAPRYVASTQPKLAGTSTGLQLSSHDCFEGGARRRGIAEALMEHAEREALAEGKTLLVLDTVTGDDAERLYERLGWTRVGVIPEYALYPDGRPCDTTVFFKRL